MALSDSCFDFLSDMAEGKRDLAAAGELIASTIWYGKDPWDYGPEIGLLREAAENHAAKLTAETLAPLLRIARLVQRYHDGGCLMPEHEGKDFLEYQKVVTSDIFDKATLAAWHKGLEAEAV
jgi:hypothetical protein